eukprot:7814318-Prorocentrum_lima.AAC.1
MDTGDTEGGDAGGGYRRGYRVDAWDPSQGGYRGSPAPEPPQNPSRTCPRTSLAPPQHLPQNRPRTSQAA